MGKAPIARCFMKHGKNMKKPWRGPGGVAHPDLGMRLGEGTRAALAMPIVEAAAATLSEMATFAEAGVSDRDPDEGATA